MTAVIEVPENFDREIYFEIKTALATAKVDYSPESVQAHYIFIVDVERHLDDVTNDFHRRRRIHKYADTFAEFASLNSLTEGQRKALETIRAANEEGNDKPSEDTKNGTDKPKQRSAPKADEPKERPATQGEPTTEPTPAEAVGLVKQDDCGIDWGALRRPFDYSEIEWRLGSVSKQQMSGQAIPYITNRAIQDRLDEVVGPGNWTNDFTAGPNGGVLCRISIRVNGEWIAKSDGADNTNIEGVKGGLSDAMKRAAVQWGMGRYLYKAKINWYPVEEYGKSHRFKDRNLNPKLEFES